MLNSSLQAYFKSLWMTAPAVKVNLLYTFFFLFQHLYLHFWGSSSYKNVQEPTPAQAPMKMRNVPIVN